MTVKTTINTPVMPIEIIGARVLTVVLKPYDGRMVELRLLGKFLLAQADCLDALLAAKEGDNALPAWGCYDLAVAENGVVTVSVAAQRPRLESEP
jgi:hypothetical protein